MKETGIIMSGDHPKLILDGIKTQTRKVIKPQPEQSPHAECDIKWGFQYYHKDHLGELIAKCPYGQVGDRLWVREKHAFYTDPFMTDVWVAFENGTGMKVTDNFPDGKEVDNLATPANKWHWRPSIHMPRWASRITLEITEVRVERVQEISQLDIDREGLFFTYIPRAIPLFKELWDSLNAKRGYGWDKNNWVWVISFQKVLVA